MIAKRLEVERAVAHKLHSFHSEGDDRPISGYNRCDCYVQARDVLEAIELTDVATAVDLEQDLQGALEVLQSLTDKVGRLTQPCQASISHGPGHQSTSKCTKLGKHEFHEAMGYTWRGFKAFSGAFDESPL